MSNLDALTIFFCLNIGVQFDMVSTVRTFLDISILSNSNVDARLYTWAEDILKRDGRVRAM